MQISWTGDVDMIDMPVRSAIGLAWPVLSRFWLEEGVSIEVENETKKIILENYEKLFYYIDNYDSERPIHSLLKLGKSKLENNLETNQKAPHIPEGDLLRKSLNYKTNQEWKSQSTERFSFYAMFTFLIRQKDQTSFDYEFTKVVNEFEWIGRYLNTKDDRDDEDLEDIVGLEHPYLLKVYYEDRLSFCFSMKGEIHDPIQNLLSDDHYIWVLKDADKQQDIIDTIWCEVNDFFKITGFLDSYQSTPMCDPMIDKTSNSYAGELEKVSDRIKTMIDDGRYPSVMLWGRPGCGKTTFCDWLSTSTDLKTIRINADQLLSMSDINVSISRLIRRVGTDLVIIDDFDSLYHNNQSGKGPLYILNSLNNMDCCVVFTVNSIDILPEAIKRPGRIDWIYECGNANKEERKAAREEIAKHVSIDIPESMETRIDDFQIKHTGAHLKEAFRRAKSFGWENNFVFEFPLQ